MVVEEWEPVPPAPRGGRGICARVGLVLPDSWVENVSPYLPSNAGQSFTSAVDTGQGLLGPVAGLATFVSYLVVLLAVAAVTLRRRDA